MVVSATSAFHDRIMNDEIVVLTARPDLREIAERWCSVVGASPSARTSVRDAQRSWRTATAVIVGEDLVDAVAEEDPLRREHVYLLVDEPDRWWRAAVEIGAAGVLGASAGDTNGVAALARVVDDGSEGCSISVVGGSGGVGATTFCAALALQAAERRLSVVTIDADPVGPGVDLVAGGERADGLRWSALDSATGLVSPDSLAGALPRHRDVATIAWDVRDDVPHLPAAARSVWAAAVRGFDVVIVDQPRSWPDDNFSSGVLGGSVLTVVIVADDVPGLAAARRQVARLRERSSVIVAVRARRSGGAGAAVVETTVGVPVVGTIRRDRRLRVAVDQGRGPSASRLLRRPARDVLDLVGLG